MARTVRMGFGGGKAQGEGGPAKRSARSSADRGGSCLQPALGPVGDGVEDRLQRASSRGQSIADAHGRTWIDESLDDAFGLELSQSFGEHAITDSRYARQQLIEASGCGHQGSDHGASPALADQLDSTLKRRAVVKTPTDHGERFYAVMAFADGRPPAKSAEIF